MMEALTKLSQNTTTCLLLSLNCCRPISVRCTVITTVITYVFQKAIIPSNHLLTSILIHFQGFIGVLDIYGGIQ